MRITNRVRRAARTNRDGFLRHCIRQAMDDIARDPEKFRRELSEMAVRMMPGHLPRKGK